MNAMEKPTKIPLPFPLRRALRKLGSDIQNARRRRRISTMMMAERAGVSRTTLYKVERGDAGVAFGTYARVLFVLGLTERLAELTDPKYDSVGLALEDSILPQRIRYPRPAR